MPWPGPMLLGPPTELPESKPITRGTQPGSFESWVQILVRIACRSLAKSKRGEEQFEDCLRFGNCFWISFLVPFVLYLQQFGTKTHYFAWYLLYCGMFTFPFARHLLYFWHLNLSCVWYLLHVGTSNVQDLSFCMVCAKCWYFKRSCGFL